MIGRWFRPVTPEDERADTVYRAIVAQARQPDLYRRLGVPDTVEGRLEMIFLHSVLVFHRARREDESGNELAQKVFDVFVADMDRSLREMGIGDLGVPKRMKRIGQSFYGRADAYGGPISTADRQGLAAALQRNLFPEADEDPAAFVRLAGYVLAAADALGEQTFERISAGEIAFPEPADVLAEAAG